MSARTFLLYAHGAGSLTAGIVGGGVHARRCYRRDYISHSSSEVAFHTAGEFLSIGLLWSVLWPLAAPVAVWHAWHSV